MPIGKLPHMLQHYLLFVMKVNVVFTLPSSLTKKLPETCLQVEILSISKELKPGNQLVNLLQAGQSRDRFHVGRTFCAPVHTSTGAHPASSTMGTVSFLGVKRPEHGIKHSPPASINVERSRTIPLLPL